MRELGCRVARRWAVAALVGLAALEVAGCSAQDTREPDLPPPPMTLPGGAGAAGGAATPPAMTPPNTAPAGSGAIGKPEPNASSSAGTAAPPPAVVAGSGGQGGSAALPSELPAFKAVIRIPEVWPGQEGTACTQVRLDNAAAANVIKLHNTLSPSSHHFIVSKVTDPLAVEEPVAPCTPFRGAVRGAALTITQKHDDVVSLPDGVAYTIEAGQLMHLELHYLNVGTETQDVMAETALYPAAESRALQEATVMLIGTGAILLAPGQRVASGQKFLALPPGMEDVRFFAITGHTHRFGERVQVSSARAGGEAETLLYDPQPFVWDAPEMTRLDPAMPIPAGGGFNFECTWLNSSDQIITFGESALAEMCFFWGYYYPKKPVTNVLLDGIDIGVFLGAI